MSGIRKHKNAQSLGAQFESAGNWSTAVSVTIGGGSPAGNYRVAFNCKGTSSVGATSIQVRFSVGAIRTSTYTIPTSGVDGPLPVSAVWTVAKGAGLETCLIEFQTGAPGNQVTLEDAEITVDGVHDLFP
jgi:hypothetical protein